MSLLNCEWRLQLHISSEIKVYQFMFHLQATEKQNTYGETSIGVNGQNESRIVNEGWNTCFTEFYRFHKHLRRLWKIEGWIWKWTDIYLTCAVRAQEYLHSASAPAKNLTNPQGESYVGHPLKKPQSRAPRLVSPLKGTLGVGFFFGYFLCIDKESNKSHQHIDLCHRSIYLRQSDRILERFIW